MPAVRPALLVLPAVAMLLLAGCSAPAASSGDPASRQGGEPAASEPAGGSGGGAAVAIPDEACDLLSADEATSAYGAAITTVTGEGGACSYSGDGGSFFLTVLGTGDDGWDLVLFPEDQPITGIGERAAGNGGSIHFQKGRAVIDIVDPDAGNADKVAGVARAIDAKL